MQTEAGEGPGGIPLREEREEVSGLMACSKKGLEMGECNQGFSWEMR